MSDTPRGPTLMEHGGLFDEPYEPTPPCIRHPVPDTPGEHCCTLCCTVVVVPEPTCVDGIADDWGRP